MIITCWTTERIETIEEITKAIRGQLFWGVAWDSQLNMTLSFGTTHLRVIREPRASSACENSPPTGGEGKRRMVAMDIMRALESPSQQRADCNEFIISSKEADGEAPT